MKKKPEGGTPATGPMKQQAISSFFAPNPKAASGGGAGAKGKSPGKKPAAKAAGAKSPQQRQRSKENEHAAPVAAASAGPSSQPAKVAVKNTPAPAALQQQQQPQDQQQTPVQQPADLVGSRIKVWWPKEKAWFNGTVEHADAAKKRHHVLYDDGDTEWIDLAEEKYQVLSPGESEAKAKKAKRRRNVVLSDDDEDESGKAEDNASEDDSDADSDFKANGVDSDDEEDEDMEASEQEEEGLEDEDGCALVDGEAAASGSKRKRASKGAAPDRKKPASAGKAGPSATPALAGRQGVGQQTPLAYTNGSAPGATPGNTSARFAFSNGTAPASTPGAFTPATAPTAGTAATGATGATPFAFGSARSAATATPNTGARASGHKARDLTPATSNQGKPPPELVLGVTTGQGGGEGEQYLARMAERFPFLHPNRIMDAQRRKPGDPGYNPRTLFIPPTFFKEKKVSEAQQQWWNFKAANFDSVLLFKVGKFYEMFEMDAYVGVDTLALSFMKGEQPHAGFPEAAYSTMAEQLARAGYRVIIIEQTETPDMMKARNEARPKGAKSITVVARQAVAVLSRGTLKDAEMVGGQPDASYVMAVFEHCSDNTTSDAPTVGICAVDVAAGQLLLGSFPDDEVRLRLRTHLTALRPVELVLPRGSGSLSGTTGRLVRAALRSPQVNELVGTWDAEGVVQALEDGNYFKDANSWPAILQQLKQQALSSMDTDSTEEGSGGAAVARAALGALGLMLQFLQDGMLDKAVLPMGRFEPLEGAQAVDASVEGPRHMALDGAALENLELLENSATGGTGGTLLAVLDHCCTPFGRRRLRQWLCRPLFRVADIERRQDAVEELMGPLADAAGAARRALSGCSDLERALARLASSTVEGAEGRDAAHVVLYEDAAKRRVKGLVDVMRDLSALDKALQALGQAGPQCELLAALVDPKRWGDMEGALEELTDAADWQDAQTTGRVVPKEGADEAYDVACAELAAVEDKIQAYLKSVRSKLACSSIKLISINKDPHVLEVPEAASAKMPDSYALVGQRKGFNRYMTEQLKELVAEEQEAQEVRDKALGGILQALVRRFVAKRDLWMGAVEAVAVLDALMSLAAAALGADGEVCRPKLVEPHTAATASDAGAGAGAAGADGGSEGSDGAGGRFSGPVFDARQLRHPACCGRDGASFVPNDVFLGGAADAPRFVLLTGPNMGGKSTLLRQVCLAAVMAQVGAWVPAASLTLSPMDAIFVRMGAKDNLLGGQSTFLVELSETGAMLRRASDRSLVVLDELGRGTATLDGAAIAAAVLDSLAHNTRCCSLFATHYHQLSDAHNNDPSVAIMHMACAVGEATEGGAPEVTFLYRLTDGACPKSYGTNVAQLAGLPLSVVRRAATVSAEHERHGSTRSLAAAGAGNGTATPMDVDASGMDAAAVKAMQDVVAALRQRQQQQGQEERQQYGQEGAEVALRESARLAAAELMGSSG